MPRRYPASASADASRPSIVAHDADAKVLEALDRCSQPLKLSAGANFAFVLALKRWAARARERLASRSKRPKKKRKGPAASSVLSKRLEFHGLRTIEIDGDGNCQFRAVSQQLFGSEEHHMLVRERAVSYMIERKAEFSCFFPGRAFDRYLTKMARSREWGDELTLRAICNALGVAIHVITSTSENWYLKYTPDEQQTAKQIFLGYVAPAHYNAFGLPPNLWAASEPSGQRFFRKKKRKVEAIAPKPKAIAKKPRMTKREKIKAGKMRCPSRSCGKHARCSYCGRTRAKIRKK